MVQKLKIFKYFLKRKTLSFSISINLSLNPIKFLKLEDPNRQNL
jgi:hypothetical protein